MWFTRKRTYKRLLDDVFKESASDGEVELIDKDKMKVLLSYLEHHPVRLPLVCGALYDDIEKNFCDPGRKKEWSKSIKKKVVRVEADFLILQVGEDKVKTKNNFHVELM